MESSKTFYGVAKVGDKVAWHRGGRYTCLIVGEVVSFTATGMLRIRVLNASRGSSGPAIGSTVVASQEASVVVSDV